MTANGPISVWVVMPTWNQRSDTLACLASLFGMTGPLFHVVLIDNGSGDGTADAVKTQYPAVECIRNETNRGFAAAVNQGLRLGLERGANYLLVLNNDTIADPGLLTELIAAVDSPRAGMVVPKIYYHADPDIIWSVGSVLNPLTLEQVGDAIGRRDEGQWETVIERGFVTLCAALITRPLLEAIGLLDERFFYYYDDADWCVRVSRAGFRILLAPKARLWHKVARASGGVDTPYHRYWMGRSSVLYFRKHAHGPQWLIVAPYRTASALKTTVRLIGQRRFAATAAYWRGLRDGLWPGRLGPSVGSVSIPR